MVVLTPLTLALAAMILALWLGASIWAVRTGLGMRFRATESERAAASMTELIRSAPAIPVIVRPDGRLEAPERLATWLGLDKPLSFVSQLTAEDGCLEPGHGQLLAAELDAAQRGSRSFSLPVRARGASRSLLVKGMPAAPGQQDAGTIILWLFDATESQSQIEFLRTESAGYRDALEALSGIIEAAPMPVWFRDHDGKLRLVNTRYVRAVGAASAADVIDRGIELVEPIGGLTPAQSAANAAAEGKAQVRTIPVTVDASRRMMRVVDVPLGEPGVATYAIDMHEMEALRSELRHLSDAQRDMFDRLSAGVVQFGPDQRLKFCNQPFTSIFALTPDAVAADAEFDRVLDAMRDSGNLPEMRDFPAWRAERRQWFRAESPQEENWLLRDGVHIRVVAQPLPDGSLLIVFEDRTEQIQLSSARDTLLRVRTATFDNLFEAIAVFAADGRLHIWNTRFRDIWGLQDEQLGSHPRIDDLMHLVADRLSKPQQAGLVRQLIHAATNERRQRGGRIAFADGRHFEFAAIPLPDGNALFVMLDVTDSRRIEQALLERNVALEETDRLKTTFVSNISYELRTPLTSIAGFAEMMMGGYAGTLSDRAIEYVQAIMDSTERLSQLISNVLDLTQDAAGAMPIERHALEVAPVLHGGAERFAAAAAEANIELVVNADPSLGGMDGDERRISQAIDQLMENAIHYTGQGGRVLLHGDGTPGHVRIVVSDDGPGMDESTRANVLDMFSRLSQRNQKETDGLGLLIVRRIVDAHGGTLSILSEPGAGTAVTMEFPRG